MYPLSCDAFNHSTVFSLFALLLTGKCLFLSGFIPEPMNAYDDHKLLNFGIGFTNIVERTSRGSADLTKSVPYLLLQLMRRIFFHNLKDNGEKYISQSFRYMDNQF